MPSPTPRGANNSQIKIHQDGGPISPAPRLTAIRTGQVAPSGAERLALEFTGPAAPGYDAEYVPAVTRDGSGQSVQLPGSHFIQFVFTPSVAHDDAGRPAIGPSPVTLGQSNLKSYVLNGDFEGRVSLALGVGTRNGFSVSSTSDSASAIHTIYIDLQP